MNRSLTDIYARYDRRETSAGSGAFGQVLKEPPLAPGHQDRRRGHRVRGSRAVRHRVWRQFVSTSGSESSSGNGGKVAIAYDVGGRGDQSFNDAASARPGEGREGVRRTKAPRPSPPTARPTPTRSQRLDVAGRRRATTRSSASASPTPPPRRSPPKYPKTTFGIVDDTVARPARTSPTWSSTRSRAPTSPASPPPRRPSRTRRLHRRCGLPLIKKFEAGFEQGVKDTKPEVKVKSST